MRKHNDGATDFLEEDIGLDSPRLPVSTKVISNIVTTVYLLVEIDRVDMFIDLIDILDNAVDGDIVIIKINCPGGFLHVLLTLMSALKDTKAYTIADCSGTVASAGTMLALSCDELRIADFTEFMIHNFTGGTYGKGHEIVSDVHNMMKVNKDMMYSIYGDFLTKKEIRKVLKGDDKYLTAQEVRIRWEGKVQAMKKISA